jgi:post-segregation antitoxin (ccd killing protein)
MDHPSKASLQRVATELTPHPVRLKREERWLDENRGAIADANALVERLGLWSDGKRLF